MRSNNALRHAAEQGHEYMQHHEQTNPRLLSIDDSVLIHRLLKERLKHEPLELHSAMSGQQGLAMAKSLQPDVILLDVNMNDMNGFEVLSALKEETDTHDIPVIFLSGSAETEDRVRGLDLGAIDFVMKPFDIAELKARIRAAVRITRLIRMLARRAQIDGMTELWNRAHFDERLESEFAEALRYDRNLALIMCDIDHFKSINDTHGHAFGDRVLEVFARILQEGRSSDIACRYGGEEFAVILPETNSHQAALSAERIRARLESLAWHGQRDVQITASFGVADRASSDAKDAAHLVASADEALYQAKEDGRNRVVVNALNNDDPAECRRSA